MKIIAVSDTHGREEALRWAYTQHPEADMFLHLGDGYSELKALMDQHPQKLIAGVAGNCDIFTDQPEERIFTLEGVKILACHGHKRGVKLGLHALRKYCRDNGIKLCFFGHTHHPLCAERDGCWFLNPGPCQNFGSKLAVAEIENGEVTCYLTEI